jgi:hypothetical protein
MCASEVQGRRSAPGFALQVFATDGNGIWCKVVSAMGAKFGHGSFLSVDEAHKSAGYEATQGNARAGDEGRPGDKRKDGREDQGEEHQ